jgi:hypothetical protein
VRIAVLLIAGGFASEALASGARVRWRPAVDPNVRGYRVYTRAAGAAYGTAVDVGLPPPAADGTMAYVVSGLVANRTYYFTVTSYGDNGKQSGLAGELQLGTVDTCVVDRCVTLTSCQFGALPDGASCESAGLCSTCRAAVCRAQAGHTVTGSKLRLGPTRQGTRLTGSATYVPSGPVRPLQTGMTLQVSDGAGALLYRAVVPAASLIGNRSGTAFRLAGRQPIIPSAPALRRLNLHLSGGTARVAIRAIGPELDAVRGLPALTWVIQLGNDECTYGTDLGCRAVGAASTCS